MRKLKLQMQTTIDGYIAGPNGEMNWLQWSWDDELKKFVGDLTEPVDCILLGRKLAEGFIPAWESRLNEPDYKESGAQKFVETHKIVFSKTINNIAGKNAAVENGDAAEVIKKLKEQPGKDIIAYGGSTFVSFLIRENLIDDYYLFVNPSAIGLGMTVFNNLDKQHNYRLIQSKAFPCGIVMLNYQPLIE